MASSERDIIDRLRQQHCCCPILRSVIKADERATAKNRAGTKLNGTCVTCRIIDHGYVPWRGLHDETA